MNRSLFQFAAYLQLGVAILLAAGCAPTQPFFLNESPDLKHYLDTATRIEYPDVEVESLPETTEAARPLAIGNHDYQFWDLKLEECVSIALNNAKFFVTTSGIAENRQNVADQFISGSAEQFGSVYDVAVQQSTTQSVPLTVDGNGNRTQPRGVLRANQIGGVEDALAEFDAMATAFVDYGTTDRPRNQGESSVSTPLFQATDVTQQSALSKRLATGGVATLRQQILYSRNNLPTLPPGAGGRGASRLYPSDWTAVLEAQVQHPLMRNRGTMINRIPVVLASLNEDISIAEFEIQVRNLVRDVEVAYWDLYVAYRNVATSIIARNSAMATARYARLQLDEGTGTRQELAQAVEQYYQFRGLLESALSGSNLPGSDRFGVYGAERRLRELMGVAPTDGRLVRPVQEPSLARVEHDWNEIVAQTLYLSPELRQTKTQIKQRELELTAAKNQILPEVNLSLLYRWVGFGDTLGPPSGGDAPAPEAGSSALEALTGGDFQEGSIRLEISQAVGTRRALTRIRNAKLRLTREKANLQEKERLLISKLSDAVAKVATHYQLVQTNAQRWQAAEQEVEARLAEYEIGRSTVNVVLQSQQRRAQAQIDYYRALGEYNKSLNYVEYLKGTMLKNNSITLREGPWHKKAYWDALERARERSAGKQLEYGVSRPEVVRQGPLREADAASEIIGSGLAGSGQHVPSGNGFLAEPGGEPLELDLEPNRQPVEVDDEPLSDLGDSSQDLLSPEPSVGPAESTSSGGSLSAPKQSSELKALTPMDEPSPGTVQPMSFSEPVSENGHAPSPVRRKPLPGES